MFDWVGWVKAATRRLTEAWRARAARRAICPLLNIDDRLLRDMGLTRAEVVECFSSPLTRTSFGLLVAHGDTAGAAHLGYLTHPVQARLVYRGDGAGANDSSAPGEDPGRRQAA